jgi:undecaprenyl-diphosphatase
LDPILLLKAALMGVVEGLTEFLPISSTGHLILAGSLIDFRPPAAAVFEIAIQTGAMFAVIWEYRARLRATLRGIGDDAVARRFVVNVGVAFVPAAVFGLLLGSVIHRYLFDPLPVAVALVVGGVAILWIERRHHRRYGELDLKGSRRARVETVDDMRWPDALKVGLLQCLALIPGTSRSGATIIGALMLGFSRRAATDFSFFLGIPTLMGAGVYSMWKQRALLSAADTPMFVVGLLVSFVSALACIRWLIRYVATHDFVPFAWYRIVFGAIVLLTSWTGWVRWGA